MRLRGSCQCGKVDFQVESDTPYPFMLCYCSICRKTTGAPTCNIMGRRASLRVTGRKHLRCHHAVVRARARRAVRSPGERWFCSQCGTHLYVLDDRWPEGVWPNAAAIDTPLPIPPEHVQLMLRYKPAWVPTVGDGPRFAEYPKLSIAEWHARYRPSGAPPRARRHRPSRAKTG
ncbi:MAG: GFA family protein [Candidatus Binatia bacterium]